ncbi:MAG: acetyl-CoA carboxylase biotin carboxyl carrier protein [Clostridiales bacterium]|jgi:acetyl-CoA carboxylase biotin carboxyl carrier protein|nr:acetyl-CoA carboxylase biotin carboxyl carrier protein [Clostridiales bacterium]
MMTYKDLKELTFALIDKLGASGLDSVSVEFGQTKIALSKSGGNNSANTQISASAAESSFDAEPSYNGTPVLAPMVGTFYAAAAPGAKPFVAVGDAIRAGEPIGIIEAMKLMNEIVSDQSGIVKEILVNNGDVVEYRQPLIVVADSE